MILFCPKCLYDFKRLTVLKIYQFYKCIRCDQNFHLMKTMPDEEHVRAEVKETKRRADKMLSDMEQLIKQKDK